MDLKYKLVGLLLTTMFFLTSSGMAVVVVKRFVL